MKLAIIDNVGVYHGIRSYLSYPIRHDRDYYNKLTLLDINPFDEVDKLVRKYNCPRNETVQIKIKKPLAARVFLWPKKKVIEFANLIVLIKEKGLQETAQHIWNKFIRLFKF